MAPPVFLAGTHEATLAVMPIELLLDHACSTPRPTERGAARARLDRPS